MYFAVIFIHCNQAPSLVHFLGSAALPLPFQPFPLRLRQAVVHRDQVLSFDQLSGLCVKLEADSSEHAARLRDVLGQIRYNARCCAVDRRAGAFLDENEILEDQDGSLYRYLTLEGDHSPIDYLQALSLEQKQHLWRIFLRDGEQPMEFAWLHEFAQEGAGFCMMEWELTLQQVLDELEFQIINQPGQFYILDPSGKQITFDFIRGGPAEKVFLKILFPVVIPHGR